MAVEVGVADGRLYYAIRCATSDGVIRETNSLRSGINSNSYIVRETAGISLEHAIIDHARWMEQAVDDGLSVVSWSPRNCEKFMSSRLYVRALSVFYPAGDSRSNDTGESTADFQTV